jgi:hypothetical protein
MIMRLKGGMTIKSFEFNALDNENMKAMRKSKTAPKFRIIAKVSILKASARTSNAKLTTKKLLFKRALVASILLSKLNTPFALSVKKSVAM